MDALAAGAVILTTPPLASGGREAMAGRTFANPVCTPFLDGPPPWRRRGAPAAPRAWRRRWLHTTAVVLIGKRPHRPGALLLQLIAGPAARGEAVPPLLVIGMPVGFVGGGAQQSVTCEERLQPDPAGGQQGRRGLAAAAVNALLRRAWLDLDRSLRAQPRPLQVQRGSGRPHGTWLLARSAEHLAGTAHHRRRHPGQRAGFDAITAAGPAGAAPGAGTPACRRFLPQSPGNCATFGGAGGQLIEFV